MIKEYNLTINDETYHIKLETLGASASMPPRKAPPAAPVYAAPAYTAPAPAPAAAPKPAAAPSDGEKERVVTPMPGNVWKVKKKVGDTVTRGDVVIILEAMKMENEIMATVDGVVAEMAVTEGQSLDTGALICVIK